MLDVIRGLGDVNGSVALMVPKTNSLFRFNVTDNATKNYQKKKKQRVNAVSLSRCLTILHIFLFFTTLKVHFEGHGFA